MNARQLHVLSMFVRPNTDYPEEVLWLILELAGICGSGSYSMFFWIYV